MSPMCNQCAFRKGCDTSQEPYNTLRATVCAIGPVPFYCHHDKSGREFRQEKDRPALADMVVCGGWQKRVRTLKRLGKYKRGWQGRYQRRLAQRVLILIDQFVAEKRDVRRKARLKYRLIESMQRLVEVREMPALEEVA